MARAQRRSADDPRGGLTTAALLAGLWLGIAGPAAGPATGGDPAAEAAPAGAVEGGGGGVAAWVEGLSHPSWAVRERSRQRLGAVPMETLAGLAADETAIRDHESRLALRQIIEHLYYARWMESQRGFLGFAPLIEDGLPDPRTGREMQAVVVRDVLPGQPAERQGLQPGDVLADLDGGSIGELLASAAASQPAAERSRVERPAEERLRLFTSLIKCRPPRSVMRVRRLRLLEGTRRIVLPARIGLADSLAGAEMQVVRIPAPPAWAGWMPPATLVAVTAVVSVESGSAAERVGLRPGDLIIGPTGQVPGTVAGLDALEQARAAGSGEFTIEVAGWLDEDVTLEIGERPVEMLNPEDLAEAQASFAAWWRECTGGISVRTAAGRQGLDLRWPLRSGTAAFRGGQVLP